MPPKRQLPLDSNPPSAPSSDEELESASESEEEEEQPKPTKSPVPKPPSSSDEEEEEDEEDEEEEEEEEGEEDAQKANPAAVVDEESESESGSESESDNEPVKHTIAPRNAPVAANVKPISSKPMNDKKPTSTTTTTTTAKRRHVEEEDEKNDKKRKKKKVSDIEDEETEMKKEEKKTPFQRIFTDEDELILLNSLIDYKKDGHDAATDMGGFLDFVKDSLHINVNKSQLQNKIQRLEKKFKNHASRAKDGKDPVISKPHELKSYLLSKQIWGKNNEVKSNGVASPKRKVAKSVKSPQVESTEEEEEDSAGGLEYPYLSQSMQVLNHHMLPVPPQGLAGLVAKKGWELIGSSNAQAFDKKWKAVLIAETKAYLERIDVVRDQTKMMLDVLESSDS